MTTISAETPEKKNVAYLFDIVCNNPSVREEISHNPQVVIIDQNEDEYTFE